MIGNLRRVRLEEIATPVRPTLGRRFRPRRPGDRLRGTNRSMYNALEQVRSGIPLNWTQIEDDPALQALAYLSSNQELTGWGGKPLPEGLRTGIYRNLAGKLPAPKEKPKQEAPKPLAGFSESVPVLTQAEENVPTLSATALPRLGVALALVAAVVLALFAFSSRGGSSSSVPAFSWISLRVDGKQISRTTHPVGWPAPSCLGFKIDDPDARRSFNMTVAYPDQAQSSVGFPISFLPATLPISPTYAIKFLEVAISPCTGLAPDPTDPGTMVKTIYSVRQDAGSGVSVASNLSVYEGQSIPLAVNLPTGDWKALDIGGANAIYWHGSPYTDVEGTTWVGDVSVMAVERGNITNLYVGLAQSGITEQMLTALVAQTK